MARARRYVVDDYVKKCDEYTTANGIDPYAVRFNASILSLRYLNAWLNFTPSVKRLLRPRIKQGDATLAAYYEIAVRRLVSCRVRDVVSQEAQDLILVLSSTGQGIPSNPNQAALCGLKWNSDGDDVLKRETRDMIIELIVAEFMR